MLGPGTRIRFGGRGTSTPLSYTTVPRRAPLTEVCPPEMHILWQWGAQCDHTLRRPVRMPTRSLAGGRSWSKAVLLARVRPLGLADFYHLIDIAVSGVR